MVGRSTDVAREAAALVLMDDDFSSIVRAIRLGRRIYDNIEKTTAYVLAIHIPIARMRWLMACAAAVLTAILYVPVIRNLFRMSRPHPIDAVVVLLASAGALVWMEAVKHRVADNARL